MHYRRYFSPSFTRNVLPVYVYKPSVRARVAMGHNDRACAAWLPRDVAAPFLALLWLVSKKKVSYDDTNCITAIREKNFYGVRVRKEKNVWNGNRISLFKSIMHKHSFFVPRLLPTGKQTARERSLLSPTTVLLTKAKTTLWCNNSFKRNCECSTAKQKQHDFCRPLQRVLRIFRHARTL